MFTRLLVPLDGSPLAESALPHAAAVASPGAEVTLVQVLVPEGDAPPVDPLEWRLRRDAAALYLERTGEALTKLGLHVFTIVADGLAAERILAIAREQATEVIVLTSHGAGGFSSWNLNSVAFKVAQRAGSSLLVVRAYRPPRGWGDAGWSPERYERILVPLDGSLRGEHVLPAVRRLVVRHDAALELAHVVAVPDVIERLPGAEPAHRGDSAFELARRYLDEVAQESAFKGVVAAHVLHDQDEYAALEDLVEQRNVDLVVLSAHGHSGRRRRAHGNLTTTFVLHGATTLLILQDLPWDDLLPSAPERSAGISESPTLRTPSQHPVIGDAELA